MPQRSPSRAILTAPANPITIIPARLAATRLPGKPLIQLGDEPMIVHVWRRAVAADIGPVLVAAGDQAIVDAVAAAGGRAILTDPDLASGTDRVAAAIEAHDPKGAHDIVVNLQGDMPVFSPPDLVTVVQVLKADSEADIATLVAPFGADEDPDHPARVKAVLELEEPLPGAAGRALYFSRNRVPAGDGPLLHHMGIYAFRRAALRRFVTLPPTALERREKLEQLRALGHGMVIAAGVVERVPPGIDTPGDLQAVRAALGIQP